VQWCTYTIPQKSGYLHLTTFTATTTLFKLSRNHLPSDPDAPQGCAIYPSKSSPTTSLFSTF